MSILPIILYFSGVLGLAISILLISIAIKKSKKPFSLLISIFLMVSLILITSGTIFTLMNKNSLNQTLETPTENSTEVTDVKSASYDDLYFMYELDDSSNNNNKFATMIIKNKSNSVFSGKINLNFINSNTDITNNLIIPIKNLMPNHSHSSSAMVNIDATDINYTLSGDFTNNTGKTQLSYSIDNITVGNNFFRFDISSENISEDHLKSICLELANEYNKNLCDGFLIYFYSTQSSDKQSFNNAIADYYLNNLNNKSNFIMY